MPSWYPGRPYKPVDMEEVDKGGIPKSKELKSKLDEWLSGNVVEPMAKAGYPNVGAGIATVPSSIAEFLAPESPYELAPGMAGVGKMKRQARRFAKDIENLNIEQIEKIYKGSVQDIIDFEKKHPNISKKAYASQGGNVMSADPSFNYTDDDLKDIDKYLELKDRYDTVKNTFAGITNKDRANDFGVLREVRKNIEGIENTTDRINKIRYTSPMPIEEKIRILGQRNEALRSQSGRVHNLHNDIFETGGDKPYLRPKGYAKQKKQIKPTAPATKQMNREEYDKMLQGKTDPNYYDRLREEFYNKEEELSPLERFLKGKGDQ